MTKSRTFIQRRTGVGLSVLLLFATAGVAWPQTAPNFSGQWKQDNDSCRPKRSGDVTLRIEHNEPELTVGTTILGGPESNRHADQTYTTDGKVSVTTGVDGDEFHTSVVWKDASLIFSIEEHEDGRILRSVETWSLIENGAALQRIRERPDGEKQVIFYRRQQPMRAEQGQP
jgi:hypothetical protein